MLVVCPTPIGNLGDITKRQREVLSGADIIACEDTRRTGKLLEALGVERSQGRPELWRYDDHTARAKTPGLVDAIGRGQEVVLTTDAGTPTISDPGYRLVRACRKEGLEVTALPGPVAAVVALSASGLATDRFYFEGFLPTKAKKRHKRLEKLKGLGATVVAYESPRRIIAVLEAIEEVFGSTHQICVGRELTKRHEEYLTGGVSEVRGQLSQRESVRGELTLCIEAMKADEGDEVWQEADRAIAILVAQEVSRRTIKEVVDELFDVPRSEIYDRIDRVVSEGAGS